MKFTLAESDPFSIFSKPSAMIQSARPDVTQLHKQHQELEITTFQRLLIYQILTFKVTEAMLKVKWW